MEVSAVTVIQKCQRNNQGSSVALELDQEPRHPVNGYSITDKVHIPSQNISNMQNDVLHKIM
jgi:hypothetical protein